MQWFIEIFWAAMVNLAAFDASLWGIVWLTLLVSLSALLAATVLALPIAAWLALADSRPRSIIITLIHALMGLPPVLVGLVVYMLLSRRGPLGDWGLLFTPTAMIIAQFILIFPIICGLAYQAFRLKRIDLHDLFESLLLSRQRRITTLMLETRATIFAAIATGLGRGLAEVGAVMIVGGNILHHTRTMTTAIALETSKGELVTAVSLGLILLLISLTLNGLLAIVTQRTELGQYARN